MTPDARQSIAAACRPVARRPVGVRRAAPSRHGRLRGGFSLIELMIAIIILGLGLVMVATMFPVAWGRARDLSEFTTKQTITPGAMNLLENLLRAAPVDLANSPVGPSLGGDFIYDDWSKKPLPYSIDNNYYWYGQPWVHELNMQNIRVKDPAFVDEDPWQIELLFDLDNDVLLDTNNPNYSGANRQAILDSSYMSAQIDVHQRLFPPIRRRVNVLPPQGPNGERLFDTNQHDDNWDDTLSTRRFAWAALYRFHDAVTVQDLIKSNQSWDASKIENAVHATRLVDFYFVTLRRPQSTDRYARQSLGNNNGSVPDPYDLTKGPVTPAAMSSDEDVMFPVAWRVQLSVPKDIQPATDPATGQSMETNIPTEVTVPPAGFTGSEKAKRMIVTMFPRGTKFIDEITGRVYTVTKVREAIDGLSAALTLDQEILQDDIDLRRITIPPFPTIDDPRCVDLCPNHPDDPNTPEVPDDVELLRTVWVFPPPVQERDSIDETYPSFAGNTPVVGIDIRTLDFAPSQ